MRRDDPTHRWRGGRVAEGGGLLNRYTVNPVSWVRIPSPPPFPHFSPSQTAALPNQSEALPNLFVFPCIPPYRTISTAMGERSGERDRRSPISILVAEAERWRARASSQRLR